MIFIKKALSFIFFTFLLSYVLFALIHYTSSSAAYANKSLLMSKAYFANEEKRLGLNESLNAQYINFLIKLKNNELKSLVNNKAVFSLIKERLANSLVLIFAGGLLILLLGLILGLYCALKQNSLFEKFTNFILMLCFSLPSFYVSLILILIFSIKLDLFPSSLSNDIYNPNFISYLHHLVLPLTCVVLSQLGIFVKFSKDTILMYLDKPYVKMCYFNNFKKIRIYSLIILDSFSVIFGFFCANFIGLLGSTYIIEKVFAYPGLGGLFLDSLVQKDYPLSLVLIIVSFFIVSFFNFLALFCEKLIFRKKEIL